MTNATSRGRGRVQFLLLATLFAAPLLAAYFLFFYFPDLRPQGTTNYGELVRPVKSLPPLTLIDADGKADTGGSLKVKWTLVYLGAADCDEACASRLLTLRQTWLALNEKRERVRRVYVAPDAAALATVKVAQSPVHKDMTWLADEGAAGARLADFFAASDAGAVYLLDPLGNWLMVYRSGNEVQTDFKGIKKDLIKLLKLSQIG